MWGQPPPAVRGARLRIIVESGCVRFFRGVIPNAGEVQPAKGSRVELPDLISSARDPFGFAQDRLFAPPEKRLGSEQRRSYWDRQIQAASESPLRFARHTRNDLLSAESQ